MLNFEEMTVAQLKDVLRERGLPVSGKKAELIARLYENSAQHIENVGRRSRHGSELAECGNCYAVIQIDFPSCPECDVSFSGNITNITPCVECGYDCVGRCCECNAPICDGVNDESWECYYTPDNDGGEMVWCAECATAADEVDTAPQEAVEAPEEAEVVSVDDATVQDPQEAVEATEEVEVVSDTASPSMKAIASLLKRERDGNLKVMVLEGRREFTKLEPIVGSQHFVSPLREVAFAPFRIRQMQYADDGSSKYQKWNDMIGNIITAGYILLCEIQDEDDAQKWQIEARNEARQILAARGPLGFFDRDTGFAWTNSIRDSTHNNVDLNFRFGIVPRIIARQQIELATRSTFDSEESDPDGFEGDWDVDDKFKPLLDALQSFHKDWKLDLNRSHHHLYCWSDRDLNEFQPSFLAKLLDWYLRDCSVETNHTAYILLIFSVGGHSPSNLNFDSFERLAIQRMRPNGNILVAPGKSNNTSLIPGRIDEIGLDPSIFELIDEIPIHGCSVGLVEETSVGILIPCWDGTWRESKEVDGEQVMTDSIM